MKKKLSALLIVLVALCGLLALLGQPPDLWLTKDQQGERLMAAGEFSAAAETFVDPTRQGSALYRAGRFEEAAAAFARVDDARSAFNRGDSLVMLGRYDDAIKSFDRALQFEPEWTEAQQNRALAVARRDRLAPPDDDAGGTGGQLEADEIVFDDRAKSASETEQIEVGAGDAMNDEALRELWLQRVQTSPGDFLRVKFSFQLARRDGEASE